MDSILTTIKKLLGIDEDYNQFDIDLIIQINMAFNILHQLGVGPKEGYSIKSDIETWSDYLEDLSKIEMVKTYIFLKTKMVFDPPASGTITECYKAQIAELEWRLNTQVELKEE